MSFDESVEKKYENNSKMWALGGLGGRGKGVCVFDRMVKSMKMGYRNFRTQQIWFLEEYLMGM